MAVVYFLTTESNLGFVDVVKSKFKSSTANSPLSAVLVYLAFETEIKATYFSSYEPFETNDVTDKIKKKNIKKYVQLFRFKNILILEKISVFSM